MLLCVFVSQEHLFGKRVILNSSDTQSFVWWLYHVKKIVLYCQEYSGDIAIDRDLVLKKQRWIC